MYKKNCEFCNKYYETKTKIQKTCSRICGSKLAYLNNKEKYSKSRPKKHNESKCRQDFTGQRFGKLLVLELIKSKEKPKSIRWKCICDCGKQIIVSVYVLSGTQTQKSCGCERVKNSKRFLFKGYEEISMTYFTRLKNNAKSRNREFNISIEFLWNLYLKQNKKCSITNLNISFSPNPRKNPELQTASLDRIDSTKGYVEGNVQWVHKDVNFMKQDYDEKYFIKICKAVTENLRNN